MKWIAASLMVLALGMFYAAGFPENSTDWLLSGIFLLLLALLSMENQR